MPQRALFPLCFAVQLGAALHADCVPATIPPALAAGRAHEPPALARPVAIPAARAPIASRDVRGEARAPSSGHRESSDTGARRAMR